MNQWETTLVREAAQKFKPRITYRRLYPESPIETGRVVREVVSRVTWLVIPDDGKTIAAIVWWDEIVQLDGPQI